MNRIKFLREEKGLYQKDLAKLLNVSVPAINYYENEKRSLDTKSALILAEYFGVSTDYLLGKSDVRNPEDKLKEEFLFAYHKETEGLSEEEILDAIKAYKEIIEKFKKNNGDKK